MSEGVVFDPPVEDSRSGAENATLVRCFDRLETALTFEALRLRNELQLNRSALAEYRSVKYSGVSYCSKDQLRGPVFRVSIVVCWFRAVTQQSALSNRASPLRRDATGVTAYRQRAAFEQSTVFPYM